MKNLSLMVLLSAAMMVLAVSCNNKEKKGIEVLASTEQGSSKSDKPQSFDDIIKSKTPVIVDFYADWCGPCKLQAPRLEEIQSELGDKVIIVKVNVDVEKELAARFEIQNIPTLYIFKEGKEIFKAIGLQEKEVLKNVVLNAQ